MDVETVQASHPVREEGAAAHAFRVGNVIQRVGAIGLAGGLDVGDLDARSYSTTRWSGRGADRVEVGCLGVGALTRQDLRGNGGEEDR